MIPKLGLSYLKERENSIEGQTEVRSCNGFRRGWRLLMRGPLGGSWTAHAVQVRAFLDFIAGVPILDDWVTDKCTQALFEGSQKTFTQSNGAWHVRDSCRKRGHSWPQALRHKFSTDPISFACRPIGAGTDFAAFRLVCNADRPCWCWKPVSGIGVRHRWHGAGSQSARREVCVGELPIPPGSASRYTVMAAARRE